MPNTSPKIDEQSLSPFKKINKYWEEKSVIGKELNKLFERLDETEQQLTATTKQKEEMAEQLSEMRGINDALKTEIAESRRNQAELLKHVNKLLGRLDEKDRNLSNVKMENNELVAKVRKVTGMKNRLQSEVEGLKNGNDTTNKECNKIFEKLGIGSEIEEAQSSLLKGTSAAAVVESTVASLRGVIEELHRENESLHEQMNNHIESENQEAQAGLPQAPSVATVSESTVTSLHSVNGELRREIESLHEQVDNRTELEYYETQAGWLQDTSAAAVVESTDTSLCSDIEDLRRENKSLQEQLHESRNGVSEEQKMDVLPLISTSSIGFNDVFTTTGSAPIPNGYRGLNWDNVWVHRSVNPGTGFEHGIVSGEYAAYNGGAYPCSISSTTPFSVAGFQATAAYRMCSYVLVESLVWCGVYITREKN